MGFNEICMDIKSLKIQGAENVARAAIRALSYRHDAASIKRLLGLRPTEPCLRNAIRCAKLNNFNNMDAIVKHFDYAVGRIARIGSLKIQKNFTVYTHCHSSTVMAVLKDAKNKKFKVHVTETRPNYQGRITAAELARLKIPVTYFVDSAMRLAIKKADIVLLGCDAITTEKIYNKIGSEMAAEYAGRYDIPLYICTDSWKFSPESRYGKDVVIEERRPEEVWKKPPRNVRVSNMSFEKINPELVTAIISELGDMRFNSFIGKVVAHYPWIQGER